MSNAVAVVVSCRQSGGVVPELQTAWPVLRHKKPAGSLPVSRESAVGHVARVQSRLRAGKGSEVVGYLGAVYFTLCERREGSTERQRPQRLGQLGGTPMLDRIQQVATVE